MRRITRTTLLSLTMTLAAAAPASAALDQESTGTSSGFAFVGKVPPGYCAGSCAEGAIAQTFTAGLNGVLVQVDLRLSREAATTAPLAVEIRPLTGTGCPSDSVLARATVAPGDVPTGSPTAAWHSIRFSDPASVTAGGPYAIVLTTASGNTYSVGSSASNPYSRGQFCYSTAPFAAWNASPTSDLFFRTFVEPDADNDGFSDETQDRCPTQADTQGDCDTTAPTPDITKGPKKKTESQKARFRFTSDDPNATFQCRLDKKPFAPCTSPKKYRKLKPRKHHFRVQPTDSKGNLGPIDSYRWRVVD